MYKTTGLLIEIWRHWNFSPQFVLTLVWSNKYTKLTLKRSRIGRWKMSLLVSRFSLTLDSPHRDDIQMQHRVENYLDWLFLRYKIYKGWSGTYKMLWDKIMTSTYSFFSIRVPSTISDPSPIIWNSSSASISGSSMYFEHVNVSGKNFPVVKFLQLLWSWSNWVLFMQHFASNPEVITLLPDSKSKTPAIFSTIIIIYLLYFFMLKSNYNTIIEVAIIPFDNSLVCFNNFFLFTFATYILHFTTLILVNVNNWMNLSSHIIVVSYYSSMMLFSLA